MKSERNGNQGSRKVKRDRYWSVMLVGDHGRIIPFRRLKGLLIFGICLLVLSIVALGVLGTLYVRQKNALQQLQSELSTAKQQAAELRDEKDLYLTQLIVKQNRQSGPAKKKADPRKDQHAAQPAPAKAAPAEKKDPLKPKPAASKPKPAPVKRAADIRRFKVTYQPDQKVLKAQFRVYNTSKPKKSLSGRTVVVFKNLDDTPIHWLPVPRVQLRDGEPTGSRGQTFKINNYRTEKFRAYGQTAPVKFNTASVYVYTDKGQLLVSKDFGFKIAYKPPPKPVEPPAAPKAATSAPASPESPPDVRDSDQAPIRTPPAAEPGSELTAPSKEQPAPRMPSPEQPDAGAPDNTGVAPDAAKPPVEVQPPAVATPGGQVPGSQTPGGQTPAAETPAIEAPDAETSPDSAMPTDVPETDPKPKPQGEPQ